MPRTAAVEAEDELVEIGLQRTNYRKNALFEETKFFSPNEVRRMGDLRFILVLIVTTMSQYFNRDEEITEYLQRYNDEFLEYVNMRDKFLRVIEFIRQCAFLPSS